MKNTEQTEKGQLGEDFVNKVAYNSFLKYWCYPGPVDILGDKKEICDLLIVFDTVCIIISVKNYSFKGDYKRYFRKTIDKGNRQIIGAEKKLFRKNKVLLKHPDRDPEEFPKDSIKEVHRIIVNLNPNIKYYRTSFKIEGKNITVMDAIAWQDSLIELNTLPDFINYIVNRCSLFSDYPAYILPREEYDFSENDKIHLWAEIDKIGNEKKEEGKLSFVLGNELDLIAVYIKNGFKFPSSLNHQKVNGLFLKIDGEWEKFQVSKINERKKKLEKESYFIDNLVRQFLIDKVNGERISKMFYKLDRLTRSAFAKSYLDYHKNLCDSVEKVRFSRTHVIFNEMNMVFVYFVDDFPPDELKNFVELSLIHHSYLQDFNCKEVGLIGLSKSFNSSIFGYLQDTDKKGKYEISELEKTFAEFGWKIKN